MSIAENTKFWASGADWVNQCIAQVFEEIEARKGFIPPTCFFTCSSGNTGLVSFSSIDVEETISACNGRIRKFLESLNVEFLVTAFMAEAHSMVYVCVENLFYAEIFVYDVSDYSLPTHMNTTTTFMEAPHAKFLHLLHKIKYAN